MLIVKQSEGDDASSVCVRVCVCVCVCVITFLFQKFGFAEEIQAA
jgi:hypothetical protein